MSKFPKKFCSLNVYIEAKDNALYQAIKRICAERFLRPPRHSNGVTFLFPDKAYRAKIISAAYSADPEKAINMIKSLTIPDLYANPSDFKGEVVNLLNQKLPIHEVNDKSVRLTKDLEIKKATDFTSLGRDNMAVYNLTGKGEIPLNGPAASHRPMQYDAPKSAPVKDSKSDDKKKKGGFGYNSKMGGFGYGKRSFVKYGGDAGSEDEHEYNKQDLLLFMEKTYCLDTKKHDNIYAAGAMLMIAYCLKKGKSNAEIIKYLGDDEFSDFYLLCMCCSESCPEAFNVVFRALNEANASRHTYADYVKVKQAVCGADNKNKSVNRNGVMDGIRDIIGIRTKVNEFYSGDSDRMARDLFVVFCNLSKTMWADGASDGDCVDSFKQFAYVAGNIYCNLASILNQVYEPSQCLTLYGFLLRSDVLGLVPGVFQNDSDVNLAIVSELPQPNILSQFSLIHLAVVAFHQKAIRGGNADVAGLLNKVEELTSRASVAPVASGPVPVAVTESVIDMQ
jgi:hypothetical protein